MELAKSIEAPAPKALIGWLLLFERMGSKYFILKGQTYEEMTDLGFTRAKVLVALGILYPQVDAYNFWMFSESTGTAIPLLNDNSILTMYELYAKTDQAVTIIVRPVDHPAPNVSETPSAVESLLERRELSGIESLRNVRVEPRHPCSPDDMKLGIPGPILSIPAHNKIELDLGGVPVAFPFDEMFDWIIPEIQRGVSPTDIKVLTMGMDRESPLQLTRSIWRKSLLRGQIENDFVQIWNLSSEIVVERDQYLQKLYDKYPDVKHNMKVLIHDLGTPDSVESQYRLSLVESELPIGEPYVSAAAAKEILQIPVDGETLEIGIQRLPERYAKNPCAANRIDCLLMHAFNWPWFWLEKELNGNFDLVLDSE